MKRIIILAAALALWAQSVQAQQWQPTTWPPEPAPICADDWEADFPGGCDGIARMNVGWQAAVYQASNQRAMGYGNDVPMDADGSLDYGSRQAQRWNAETGRYDNESWMWQPAPQNQAQWDQRRRQAGR